MEHMKTAQLTLLTNDRPWSLDDGTRRTGREGLAKARAALAPHLAAKDELAEQHELAA